MSKKENAEKLLKEIRSKNIKVTIVNDWITLGPPSLVPPSMLVELMSCTNEFKKLYLSETQVHSENL